MILMGAHSPKQSLSPNSRRPSRLGRMLVDQKLEEARRLLPEERLLRALDLSDLCLDLQRACFEKLSR